MAMKAINTSLGVLLSVSAYASLAHVFVTLKRIRQSGRHGWLRCSGRFARVDWTLSQSPQDLYRDSSSGHMNDIIIKILAELLSTLMLATKEIKWGRFSESVVGKGTSSLSIIQLKYHSPSSPSFHVLSQQEMPIQCSESCSARTNHLMVLWTGPDGWNS